MVPDDHPHDDASPEDGGPPTPSPPAPPVPQLGDDVPFSPSILFRALAEVRQRYALYYLLERDGRGRIDEMAEPIAAWESDTTPERLTDRVLKHTYSGLYHASLPKLDEFGLVEFDPETGTVTATDALDEITPYLEIAKQVERDAYDRFRELLEANSSSE